MNKQYLTKKELGLTHKEIKEKAKKYKENMDKYKKILDTNILSRKRLYREVINLIKNYKQEFQEVNMEILEDTIVISATYMMKRCKYIVNHDYTYTDIPLIYIDDELYTMDRNDYSPVMTIPTLFITFCVMKV